MADAAVGQAVRAGAYGFACYTPNQFQKAYNLGPLYANGWTGKGKTIAIIDSFGDADRPGRPKVYDKAFGLPDPPSYQVIQPAGAVPPFDPTNDDMVGWAQEATLDIEMAHAMAPGANILLVETRSPRPRACTASPRS